MQVGTVTYIVLYIFIIAYLAFLAGHLFTKKIGANTTENGGNNIERIHRSIGRLLIALAGLYFIYIPVYILLPHSDKTYWYCLLFPVNYIVMMPFASHMFNALLQRHINNWYFDIFQVPNIILTILFVLTEDTLYLYISVAYIILLFIAYIIYYGRQYRRYNHVLKSEYSNTENRDLKWSWPIMISFVLQMTIFGISELSALNILYAVYLIFTVANATFMVFYTHNLLPVAHINDADNLIPSQGRSVGAYASAPGEDRSRDTEMRAIDLQLEKLFVEQQLYTNPNLTRDMLCQSIGYNRNILARYFREKGVNYYKFVNNYRINYACQLMEHAAPHTCLQDIAKQCGYSTYRTFNTAFQEEKGILPSEYKKHQ